MEDELYGQLYSYKISIRLA